MCRSVDIYSRLNRYSTLHILVLQMFHHCILWIYEFRLKSILINVHAMFVWNDVDVVYVYLLFRFSFYGYLLRILHRVKFVEEENENFDFLAWIITLCSVQCVVVVFVLKIKRISLFCNSIWLWHVLCVPSTHSYLLTVHHSFPFRLLRVADKKVCT